MFGTEWVICDVRWLTENLLGALVVEFGFTNNKLTESKMSNSKLTVQQISRATQNLQAKFKTANVDSGVAGESRLMLSSRRRIGEALVSCVY